MTTSPIKTAQDVELAQRLQGMAQQDPELVRFIAAAAIGSQQVQLTLPYFSRVRFSSFPTTVGNVFNYAIAAGTKVNAFSYGQGESMGPAGFARNATPADTNLEKGRSTRGGETIEIHGISIVPVPVAYGDAAGPRNTAYSSDAKVLAFLLSQTSCQVNLKGGNVVHDYGPLILCPSPVGQSGLGPSQTQVPPIDSGHMLTGYAANGWSYAGNLYRLPEPYIWTPSGDTDASFQVTLELRQALAIQTSLRVAAAGIAPYVPPEMILQEFIVSLLTSSSESRGVNQ